MTEQAARKLCWRSCGCCTTWALWIGNSIWRPWPLRCTAYRRKCLQAAPASPPWFWSLCPLCSWACRFYPSCNPALYQLNWSSWSQWSIARSLSGWLTSCLAWILAVLSVKRAQCGQSCSKCIVREKSGIERCFLDSSGNLPHRGSPRTIECDCCHTCFGSPRGISWSLGFVQIYFLLFMVLIFNQV